MKYLLIALFAACAVSLIMADCKSYCQDPFICQWLCNATCCNNGASTPGWGFPTGQPWGPSGGPGGNTWAPGTFPPFPTGQPWGGPTGGPSGTNGPHGGVTPQ